MNVNFLSHATNLALLQSKFHRATKYQMIKTLKPFEINTVEWVILGYLDHIETPVPFSVVASEVGIQDSFMAVLAARLEEREFVTVKQDTADKRKKNISISKQGRKMIELSQLNFIKFFSPLLKGLDKNDLDHFVTIITKIINNFEEK